MIVNAAGGKPCRFGPHPVVDRGQVIEHCVRSIDLTLEISQDFSHTLARSPKRRYPVAGKLWSHIAAICSCNDSIGLMVAVMLTLDPECADPWLAAGEYA